MLLPDDIMDDDAALLRSMLAEHAATGGSVLGLEEVPPDQTASYGCVDPVATDRPGVVVDYVPVFASPCGMGFAYWEMQ